jgi:tetraprenyl-beta-curcumene synthase
MARASLALALANARYWSSVAPLVRAHLHRWEQRACAIPDPVLRQVALENLHAERFNAEVAAMLATPVAGSHRASAVEAIVALEIMYDYLDGLIELPMTNPLEGGRCLSRAFTDALDPHAEPGEAYYSRYPHSDDGGYLEALLATVRVALARLPAAAAIREIAQKSAARCAEAQVRVHAVPRMGAAQLEEWAKGEAAGTALQWREFLAGAAASVLAVHALIAAAGDDRTTGAKAAKIDETYLAISALSTMLDSVVDYEHDIGAGEPWYVRHFEDRALFAGAVVDTAEHAATQARALPNGAHHVMLLVAVVAYYTSAPTARGEFARPVIVHIHQELQPLITPTLAVMRVWRGAKQLHLRRSWIPRGAMDEVAASR